MNEAQIAELARLKAYFPFSIVYGVLHKDTGEFEACKCVTMARPNRLAREGHSVYLIETGPKS